MNMYIVNISVCFLRSEDRIATTTTGVSRWNAGRRIRGCEWPRFHLDADPIEEEDREVCPALNPAEDFECSERENG